METINDISAIIALLAVLENAFNYTVAKKDTNGTTITIFFPKTKKIK